VRLLAPPLASDDHAKDIDFSPDGIRARWDAGYLDTVRGSPSAVDPPDDPKEGFVLHEAAAGQMIQDS